MNDVLNNAIKLQTLLEQYRSTLVVNYNEMLEKTLDSIILKLEKLPSDVGRARLNSMLAETVKLIMDEYDGFMEWLDTDQRNIAELAYNTSAKAFETALGTGVATFSKLPESVANRILDPNRYILGATMKDYQTGLSAKHVKDFKQIIAQGVIQGTNTKEIAKSLRDASQILSRNAETIALTVIGNAQQESYNEVANQFDEVIDYAFSEGTLDSRTSPICQKYTGQSWRRKKGESLSDFIARIPDKPKRHYNCRSSLVYMTKEAHDALQEIDRPAVVDSEKKTVKHRDGTTSTKHTDKKVEFVKADITFDEFFQKQSAKFQKQVLGEKRYKLMKEGRLTIKDVRDIRTNSYKTIEELRDIIDS